MIVHGYAAMQAKHALTKFSYEQGALEPHEVRVAVEYCGICHSDIHMIDNDWGISTYPLVPGHEIVGIITEVGSLVANFSVGDRVGIGWQCGSCMACEWCIKGEEPCCHSSTSTIVGRHGGFVKLVCVDSRFVFPLPEKLDPARAAPLFCGGITVFTPLSQYSRPLSRVGIIGCGGLGHLAVQFANAFGCEVTAFSTTPSKEEEIKKMGAHRFVICTDTNQLVQQKDSLDLILSTVFVNLDWELWLSLLRPKGTFCLVGAGSDPINFPPSALLFGQKTLTGSIIGARRTIRSMLEFSVRHQITAQVEVIPINEANSALEKVRENKARYRVVLQS